MLSVLGKPQSTRLSTSSAKGYNLEYEKRVRLSSTFAQAKNTRYEVRMEYRRPIYVAPPS